MVQAPELRRHLYEQLAHTPLRSRRTRRGLRRQVALLSSAPPQAGPDGSAGVREPRRPLRPHGGPGRALLDLS